MKIPLTLLLLMALATSAMAQQMPDNVAYNHAYEKVIQKNKVEKSHLVLRNSSEEEFNHNDTINTVVYNEKGKPIYLIEPARDEWDATYIDSFTYNSKGLLGTVILRGYDMYDITHLYTYDNKGNIITSAIDGAEPRKYTYQYNNNKISVVLGQTAYYEVDDEGDYTGAVTWSDVERLVYEYSEKGRLTVFTYYYFDEVYSRTTYSYDKENRLIQEYTPMGPEDPEAPDDSFYFISTYTYGADGLLESLTETNSEGVSYPHTFEYKKK